MGDIALRGNKLTRTRKFGGGRTNLLEELGRVEAEPSNRNRRAEISRVHGELNRGYAKGGRAGFKHGGSKKSWKHHDKVAAEAAHDLAKRGKKQKTFFWKGHRIADTAEEREKFTDKKADGGRVGLKKGGKSKPWGTGPKPGTIEFVQHHLHKPRKGKATGNIVRGAGRAAKSFVERVGGSEKGKPHSTKEGRIASGKRKIKRFLQSRAVKPKPGPTAPSRPKKPWPPKHTDLLRRFPKVPQPHKSPGDSPHIPMPKQEPLQPKKYQPAAEGGRIGFKKGTDKKWMQKVSASIKKRGTKGKCTPITKPGCTGRAKALAKTFKKIAARRKA